MPSRAAFLSGRYGVQNGVATHGSAGQTLFEPRTKDDWDGDSTAYWTLPEVLFNGRIHTGAVSSFPRHPAPWFHGVWNEFYTPQEPVSRPNNIPTEEPRPTGLPGEGFQTPRAGTVANLAIDFIKRHQETDFFLYTQFWDPHEPYNRTEEEIEEFRGETPLPPYPTADQISTHRDWDAVRSARDMNISSRSDLQEILARYDAEIRYADKHVGRIIESLQHRGLYEDTLVMVIADHGEEFGEHGAYRHHWSTFDGTQRIPFIIKPPGGSSIPEQSMDELTTNVDLAPTVLDYFQVETPDSWHGESLRPLMEGADRPWRDFVVFDHGLYMAQRAVRTADWKLIRTYHSGVWAGEIPEIQLYDMTADPWEQSDVAGSYPDVVQWLEENRLDWEDEHEGPYEDSLHRVARKDPQGYTWFKDSFDGV
jgi:arylsulfatase A-like enzyme